MNFLIFDTWHFYKIYYDIAMRSKVQKEHFVYRIRRLQITIRRAAFVYKMFFFITICSEEAFIKIKPKNMQEEHTC